MSQLENINDNVSADMATLLSDELINNMTSGDRMELVDAIRKENNRLQAENHVLRKQLYLLKMNSGLRIASLVSTLIGWLDEKGGSSESKQIYFLTDFSRIYQVDTLTCYSINKCIIN